MSYIVHEEGDCLLYMELHWDTRQFSIEDLRPLVPNKRIWRTLHDAYTGTRQSYRAYAEQLLRLRDEPAVIKVWSDIKARALWEVAYENWKEAPSVVPMPPIERTLHELRELYRLWSPSDRVNVSMRLLHSALISPGLTPLNEVANVCMARRVERDHIKAFVGRAEIANAIAKGLVDAFLVHMGCAPPGPTMPPP